MSLRRIAVCLLIAGSTGLGMNPGVAAPHPRGGYVWADGYWRWNGHRYFWVDGRWVRARHGWHWVPDHWVAAGPRWHFVPGHWER